MANPKRRWSKERTRTRRANWKKDAPTVVECPHCHELKLTHRVCPECGYYAGEQVIEVKAAN